MDLFSPPTDRIVDRGVECARAERFGEAGQRFLEALGHVEATPDGADRSKQLGLLADICSRFGHPDLALMALQGLLESSHERANPARYTVDLLTLANSWSRLGQAAASAAVNQSTLDYALAHGMYANAASASTNLAMKDANAGRLAESLRRLQESLDFLKKGANPQTEAITRLSLIQVVDAMGADPALALDASADIFTRLQEYVGPNRWRPVQPAFHRLVDRYIAARPDLDGEAWKRKTFPLIFGDHPQ